MRYNKSVVFIFVALLTLSLSILSCGGGDDSSDSSGGSGVTIVINGLDPGQEYIVTPTFINNGVHFMPGLESGVANPSGTVSVYYEKEWLEFLSIWGQSIYVRFYFKDDSSIASNSKNTYNFNGTTITLNYPEDFDV